MKPLLVYDCEIIKAIPSKKERAEPGIEYCGGWRDFECMGISVIGAYDYATRRYRVFCGDNFDGFLNLVEDRICVGFNNNSFDNQLVAANGIQIGDSYDLLVEVWAGAGLGAAFNQSTHGGYGLDAICATNFEMRKTGKGALAPILWQRGDRGRVIDYCLNDVAMTVRLLDHVIEYGWVINPTNGEKIYVRRPSECFA